MITLDIMCRIFVFTLLLDLRLLILVARLNFGVVIIHSSFAIIFLLVFILILTHLLLLPILVVLSTAFFLDLIAATVSLIARLSALI